MKSILSTFVIAALCSIQMGCDSTIATGPSNAGPANNVAENHEAVRPSESIRPTLNIIAANDDAKQDSKSKADDSDKATEPSNPTTAQQPEANPARPKDPVSPKDSAEDDKVLDVTFVDLQCGLAADVRFRDFMLADRAKELVGRQIRIAGNMFPNSQFRGITEFILLKNKECLFGPGGQADHLIIVQLKKGLTTSFRGKDTVYEVVGRLTLNPDHNDESGFTNSIYDMECESVTIR